MFYHFISHQSKYQTINKFLGETVTVMSSDGKPVQLNPTTLHVAAAQNAVGQGMLSTWK